MTTMELIERGIGHNCLSDAYNLAISDMREIVERMRESALGNMMHREAYACDRFLEQLKKLEGKK